MLLQLHYTPNPARFRAIVVALACAVGPAVFAVNPAVSSPAPERIAARDAWRMAESLAASKPDYDIVIGRGGSMLPLYPDGTVLLLRRLPLSELHNGMTVVFIGDHGRPVAHALVEKTWRGWVAKGLNNTEPDQTRVRAANYLGTVVRAFTPVVGEANSPELAAGGE